MGTLKSLTFLGKHPGMKKLFPVFACAWSACFAQLTAPPAVMTNDTVLEMLKKGMPESSILSAITQAPKVDFLVNNYEIFRMTEAGAKGKEPDNIASAMGWRLNHAPGGSPPAAAPPAYSAPPRGPALSVVPRRTGSFLVLEDATPVKLRLARNLSSADAQTGETVDFEVLEDVKLSDRIIIAKGATAIGTVTNAEAKKRMGRGGKLDVTIDFVRLADGEKAALRGIKDAKGGSHAVGMTIGIVASAALVWPAAPVFLLMHGKDITIPKGTEITAYTNGNMTIEGSVFQFDPLTAQR